jgi:hypothetical protein
MYQDLCVLCNEYLLPDLKSAINSFLGLDPNTVCSYPCRTYWFLISELQDLPIITAIHTWDCLRIRLPTVQDEEEDAPAYTVQALPPSRQLPCGQCHCVLVHSGDDAENTQIKGELINMAFIEYSLD